jgi:hypothetical protein
MVFSDTYRVLNFLVASRFRVRGLQLTQEDLHCASYTVLQEFQLQTP